MNVTIIGEGGMATVSSILLADNGHHIRLWGFFPEAVADLRSSRENKRFLPGVKFPDSVVFTADPAEAFASADGTGRADFILATTPTQFIRLHWRGLTAHCPAGLPIVSVAKGIENDTLLRPSQVLAELLGAGGHPMAVLSGPNIARELAQRKPATATVASADPALARTVQQAFSTGYFRVYTNPDLVGVELAGAVKNVIAIAAGILDGLGAGDNAKAALLTRGLVEIARLGVAMGARRETFTGLAGLGDLVTTCVSPFGRNRSFGEAVGRGRKVAEVLARTASVVEGVATTRSVLALAGRCGVEMPITQAVHAVLFDGKPAAQAIDELMRRSPKGEDAEWV
jgi:glycerol-3-phosphate dehydrogenase (NAD(P)+)